MKKYTVVLLATIITFTSACNKFLEKEPDSNRATIQTPEQMSQLLISAYPKASYMTFCEAMSDNADDKSVGEDNVTNSSCYRFEETNAQPSELESPQMYWVEAYKAIAVANHALDIIRKSATPEIFNAQKGEALVARAYAHFMLVCFFSPFYNPATAASDMGIPYVDQPEDVVNKNYDRRTVAYVYQRIETDLLEGIPLLQDNSYEVPKYHFTKAAAHAFASRFYLVLRDYARVLEHANAVFPANNFADQLRPWNGAEWDAMGSADLRLEYTKSSLPSNIILAEAGSLYGRNAIDYRYAYTFDILNECFAVRNICNVGPTWQFENQVYGVAPHFFIPKFGEYFKRASINANFGDPYIMVPLFDAEEVLFNRAEARAYLGDAPGAIADMNTYISKRAQNYNATSHAVTEARLRTYAGTQHIDTAAVKGIIGLRRMEFAFQGLRWFDIQRYGLTVTHTVRTTAGSVDRVVDVRAGDPRRVLQIPATAVLSGIPLNPR